MSGKRRVYPTSEDQQQNLYQQSANQNSQQPTSYGAPSPNTQTFVPTQSNSGSYAPSTSSYQTPVNSSYSSVPTFPQSSQQSSLPPQPVSPTNTQPPPVEPPTETAQDLHNPNPSSHGKKRVYFTNPEDQTSYEEQPWSQPAVNPGNSTQQLTQGMQQMSMGGPQSQQFSTGAVPHGAPNPSFQQQPQHQQSQTGEVMPVSIAQNIQCPPLYMRMTMNAVGNSTNLINKSGIPFGVVIHPLAEPQTKEDKIPVVNFGVSGIVRCRRCRGYINPFVSFVDGGRRWRCNLCGLTNDVPQDYFSPIDTNGRRFDMDQRPELSRGCVEFIAPSEYMVRPPQPPCYIFVIDVGHYSLQSGMFYTVIETIKRTLDFFPGSPRTRIGFITFDTSIHFYNLKSTLSTPQMLVVSDIDDVFLPLPDDMLVNLADSRTVIEALLNKFPAMFPQSQTVESVAGVAMKAAFEMMKNIGGKIMLFASALPSQGVGKLKNREDMKLIGTDKETSLLNAESNWYKESSLDCSRQQVSVDCFLTPQQFIDVATLGSMSQFTGGQVYFYPSFKAQFDGERMSRDLQRDITRETGFEAVMRVRMSKGLKAQAHFGNFFIRSTDLLALPNIDSDKAFGVQLALAESTVTTKYASFQCALLYTTSSGERRIRVFTQCLPVTNQLVDLFKSADVDAVTTLTAKMAVEKALTHKLSDAREALVNKCLEILTVYKTDLAPSSNNTSLMLPETLKLFPLYILGLIKSIVLKAATDVRPDERSYYIMQCRILPTYLTIPFLYARMYGLHNLPAEAGLPGPNGLTVLPPLLNVNSEKLERNGIFLLEDGQQMWIWIAKGASPELISELFGVPSLDGVDTSTLTLPILENSLSARVQAILNEIRRQRSTWLQPSIAREGEPREIKFFSFLIEDRSKSVHSYYEFLVNLHQRIQAKVMKK